MIIKDPHLDELRAAVSELKRILDGEPNEVAITRAWDVFDNIGISLMGLCPNLPRMLLSKR